jgi:hypothetical protein
MSLPFLVTVFVETMFSSSLIMACQRHMNAPGRLIIRRPGQANNLVPLETNVIEFFGGLGQGWPKFR